MTYLVTLLICCKSLSGYFALCVSVVLMGEVNYL